MNQARLDFAERYQHFRVDVPEGSYYIHEIRRITMSDKQKHEHNAMYPDIGRFAESGTFTQLLKYGRRGNPYEPDVVMSDHLCEVADHQELVDYARDHAPLKRVLINGLGIGVAIELLAPYVEQFTIIELEKSVIKLVAPHYLSRYPGRVEVVESNALTYQPTQHYDAVFHDIWTFIDAKNLRQMNQLEKRYRPFCDWQQSWAREYCEQMAREKREDHPHRSVTASNGGMIFID